MNIRMKLARPFVITTDYRTPLADVLTLPTPAEPLVTQQLLLFGQEQY